MKPAFFLLALGSLLAGCSEMPKPAQPSAVQGATAIFAGGCFWCVEQDFEKLDGVLEAESGYTGGRTSNPTYEQVGYGLTGHVEAVRVIYDPKKVSYDQLLAYYWRSIDPTAKNRQFCDSGPEYRSVIFWQTEEERLAAEASREALLKSGRFPVVHTEILPAAKFWMAEIYHQDYYKKNPIRYGYYRMACGRDARVNALWGTG
jgi:peptide-methionine (S)-S-oxide reductase